jgi:predicted PurR-regulated permease PerM
MGKKILLYSALFIVATYFLFTGLVAAQSFLVPLATAMVLAFLVAPIAVKLEERGWHKALATLTSTLALLIVLAGFLFMLFQQIRAFTQDWEEIQEQLQEKLVQASKFVEENTPLNNVSFGFGAGGDEKNDSDKQQGDRRRDDRGDDAER